jgi:hypothetical protein
MYITAVRSIRDISGRLVVVESNLHGDKLLKVTHRSQIFLPSLLPLGAVKDALYLKPGEKTKKIEQQFKFFRHSLRCL